MGSRGSVSWGRVASKTDEAAAWARGDWKEVVGGFLRRCGQVWVDSAQPRTMTGTGMGRSYRGKSIRSKRRFVANVKCARPCCVANACCGEMP